MKPAFWMVGGLVVLAVGCAEHKTIYPAQPTPVYVSQPAAPRPSQPAGATLPPPTRLRAQELNGDRQGAAQSLRTYLRRRPDAPDRQQVEARIRNLER